MLGGALVARGGDGATPQFDYAPHDEGAPRPARRVVRDRSLRSSANRASPDLPRGSDPSTPRARARSLTHWWLTAYACSTPWQASISRTRPRAATMALWAAGRRMALFVAMLRWPSRRVDARRGVLVAPSAARGAPWRYRCVRVDVRLHTCGSSRVLACPAVPLCVDVCVCVMCSPTWL